MDDDEKMYQKLVKMKKQIDEGVVSSSLLSGLTKPQKAVVIALLAGMRLFWFGDHGREMKGHSHWANRRTIKSLLKRGVIKLAKNSPEHRHKVNEFILSR